MWSVSLALLPAASCRYWFFGLKALFITALCIVSSVVFEQIYFKIVEKKSVVGDGSAFLTGLLLGMNMPAIALVVFPVYGACPGHSLFCRGRDNKAAFRRALDLMSLTRR